MFSLATPLHSPLALCSENPDYHLLTDANLSYSMRYAPAMPPAGHHHASQQQQQYGGGPPGHHPGGHHPGGHHGHLGGPPGSNGLGGSAPHMLHVGGGGPMGPGGPRANGTAGGATVTMAVPEDKVGVVIGKQASRGKGRGVLGCWLVMVGHCCLGLPAYPPTCQPAILLQLHHTCPAPP